MNPQKPSYAPNVVNQTVTMNGYTWKGNPGTDWSLVGPAGDNPSNTGGQQQAITDALDKQRAGFDKLVTAGKNDITDFLTRYSTAVPQTINDVTGKYKIPEQTNIVNSLNSRIQDLQGNTSNSGAGGFASAGQVDAAINSRYLPQFNTAVSNLGTSSTAANNEIATRLTPYTTEASMLNDRLAREMTGFTAEQQTQLQTLVDQLNAGVTLTGQQLQYAEELAKAKYSYDQALATAQTENLQPQSITAGNWVYDPASGSFYNPQTGQRRKAS